MIYFLMGPEDFLREDRLARLREEIPPEEREASIVDLPGAGLTPDLLAATTQALPFFSTRRLVIVRGLLTRSARRESGSGGGEKGQWEAYAAAIDQTPDTTTVAFVDPDLVPDTHALLKRRRPHWQIERFVTPRPSDLPAWIRRRATAKRVKIAPAAAAKLVEAAGPAPKLRQIDVELDKLAAYAGDRPIEAADVVELVSEAGSANIFALSDALLQGRNTEALGKLRALIDEGTDPHQILAILAGQIRVAVHVRRSTGRGRPPDDLRGALGLSPRYPLDKSLAQASRHPIDALERAYQDLLAIDWDSKTGRGELETALDVFVAHGPLAGH